MAYGTASGPDDVERYYTDIRGGRPPTPEHLQELKERYVAIGNRFPLLATTRRQASALEAELNSAGGDVAWKAYLGMKHCPPFIPEGVAEMRRDRRAGGRTARPGPVDDRLAERRPDRRPVVGTAHRGRDPRPGRRRRSGSGGLLGGVRGRSPGDPVRPGHRGPPRGRGRRGRL